MSLDVSLTRIVTERKEVYTRNITHNLNTMAEAAGIYKACWRPEELFASPKAYQLIPLLEEGLAKLKANPEYYKTFNATNGWGIYEDFVLFVEDYLYACKEDPDADVEADR
jgi:hypothetical protein